MNRSVIIIVFFCIRFISKPLFLCWEPITSRFSIVPPPLYTLLETTDPLEFPLKPCDPPPPPPPIKSSDPLPLSINDLWC